MKSMIKPLILVGLLATAGVTTFAASGHDGGGMMGHDGGQHGERMGKMDPAKMQARMDKRLGELKAQLKITAAQESAWTTYTAAMKPPAGMMAQRPDPAEMQKLTTPERIDKMQALHTKRMTDMSATMTQRAEATKTLYALLSPEQKKSFDENAMQSGGRHGHMQGMQGMRDGQPKS